MISPPVIVICGGPSGLSTSFELKKREVPHQVLESGPSPGASWNRMPFRLRLVTPWNKSVLFDTRTSIKEWFAFHDAKTFHRYLCEQSEKHELPVRCHSHVNRLHKSSSGAFSLDVAGEQLDCSIVVNATGYFQEPYIPPFLGIKSLEINHFHSGAFTDPKELQSTLGTTSPRILIVGRRVSAGQIAKDCHEAGFDVSISARGQISFSRNLDSIISILRAQAYYVKENYLAKHYPLPNKSSYPPMQSDAVKEYIETGKIKVLPDIKRFERRTTYFKDGSVDEFDAILFATGYRPALSHLQGLSLDTPQSMESPTIRNLFFIGFDRQNTFRSRYLRGIREDARRLAKIVAARLRTAAD